MKFKKIVSLFATATMAVSSFAGLSVTASAAANTVTAEVGKIYKADQLFKSTSTTDSTDGAFEKTDAQKTYYTETLGAPFGDESTVTWDNYQKCGKDANVDTDINYNITTEGTYTFSVFVLQYGGRHPHISLDGTELVNGTTVDIGNSQFIGTGGSRNLAIMQVETDLSAGPHTFSLSSGGRVQGVMAAVLNGDVEEAPEEPKESVTYTWDFTSTEYFKNAIDAGKTIISDQGEATPIMSNPGSKLTPDGGLNSSTMQGAKVQTAAYNTIRIDVPEGDKATISLGLTCASGSRKFYIRDDANGGGTVAYEMTGYTKNVLDKTYTFDLECGKTYYIDSATANYNYFLGKVELTVYPVVEEPGETDEPIEPSEPTDVSVDLTNLDTKNIFTADEIAAGSSVSFGLNAAGERVAANAADAVIVFNNAKFHSKEHGINYGSMTVPVSGTAEIQIGTCAWGSDVIVKDADGNTVATANSNTGACYHGNPAVNVVTMYYKANAATTLTITGGSYVPFVSVKAIDASEIPNDAKITFDASASGAEGTAPAEIVAEIGSEVTIPRNTSLYVAGKTLTAWTDGTKNYAPGSVLVPSANVKLTPVFTNNTVKLGEGDATVDFTFRRDSGAIIYSSEGGSTILVSQAVINGTSIDVKVDVDTSNGKFANGNWNDWAQANKGTKFTVPVVEGSVVTVGKLYSEDGKYTIGGVEKTGSDQSVKITDAETCDIVVGDPNGGYWRGFTVTYPQVGGTAPEIPNVPEIANPFTKVYIGNGSQITTGNTHSDNTTYTFADGMDDIVYDIFGDASDSTKVNKSYTSSYLNYIGGTASNTKGKPYISGLNLAAGAYKIYFVGTGNTGNEVIATIGNTEVKTKDYVRFANNGTKDLNLYTLDLTLNEAVSNGTLYFDCPNYWLPDLYCVAITNEAVSYAVYGTITSDDGASFNGDTIKFISSRGKEFEARIYSDNTFAVSLPKAEYTAFIDNIYYRVKASSAPISVSGNTTGVNVAVEKETAKNVKVTLINAPANGTEISFGNVKVAFAAGETEKTVSLNPGEYAISSSNGSISTLSKTALTVAHEDTYKNIYYPETIPAASGYNVTVGSNGEYKTITDALAGLAQLPDPTATNRATITLAAGETFREQVRVNVPYVTITTDAANPAKVTWYYGIGCTYYSLGADGWYNKDRAMTKIDKLAKGATNWGTTIQLDANGIKLENLYIENSFNQYYTDEEFEDGVEPNGLPDCGQQDRTTLKANGVAADSSTATERACALYFRTSENEFYNCTIISSQDTIGTGGSAYFNECTLVGNTDYICAGGDIVFDNCDLLFGGYSDTSKGGALTAANGDDAYVFRNCTIGNYQNAAGTRKHGTHTYGRDWGGEKAHVFFLNCDVQDGTSISGWGNMGGAVDNGKADLHVYDFSNPGAYKTAGSKDPYNITPITFATAKAKYENVIDMLGFTPDKMATAVTTKEALSNASEDRQDADGTYVYGVVTTIKQGSDASIDSITWTVKSGDSTYSFSTSDTVDGEDMLNKGTFPTISGEGTAEVAMLFHAKQGTYEVVSQAE